MVRSRPSSRKVPIRGTSCSPRSGGGSPTGFDRGPMPPRLVLRDSLPYPIRLAGEPPLAMPRILLVEDNEMNRDMLSRRLARKGFEVVLATDGPQGLDVARSGSFDLILMDLSLPGIDGWEATRRLKADPTTRSIPII